uniref:Putative defense protein n=1 Tax=Locusta migratoria TaxID=7004 RepID=DFP_LOCMI|nr:RecName: Full=Putative defense protein; AltName: Full=Basic 19 kDa hemolymph protein; Flags: Precursor [Locusta migratoria]AAA29283.1 basic 19k protein precursor [Locusta migratoria]prf//1515168A hemolymph protein 19kD [Locusta migratoria]
MKLVVAAVLAMAASRWRRLSAHGQVPSSTCADMLPVHGNAMPSTALPYTITVSPTSVNGGDTVRVHISGTEEFRGVYLQRGGAKSSRRVPAARRREQQDRPVRLPAGHNNAFSYISRTPLDTLDIDWKAPYTSDEIVFRATFVKSFSEFWVGVESPKITLGPLRQLDNAVAA